MARIVVRILPNDHPTDASLTALRTGVGDVVELVDDHHKFSFAELNCGHYRIIDVPGVPQERFTHLKDNVEDENGEMIQRRRLALDHSADIKLPELPKAVQAIVDSRDAYFDKFDALASVAPELIAAASIATAETDPDVQKAAGDFAVAKSELAQSLAAVDEKDPVTDAYIASAIDAVAAVTFAKPLFDKAASVTESELAPL